MTDVDQLAVASPADVSTLKELFEALQRELEAMLGGEGRLSQMLSPEFLELAYTAYYFGGVQKAVEALIAAADAAATAGDDGGPDPRLVAHGLTDAQLAAKFFLVHRRMTERNAILQSVSDGRAPSLLGLAQKKVMEAFDLILDSFADALHIGGSVKEFKKILEHAL